MLEHSLTLANSLKELNKEGEKRKNLANAGTYRPGAILLTPYHYVASLQRSSARGEHTSNDATRRQSQLVPVRLGSRLLKLRYRSRAVGT